MDKEPDIDDKQVADIDREKAFNAPKRIHDIVDYIMTNFNRKTYRNEKSYTFNALTNISEVVRQKTQKRSRKSNRNCGFRGSILFSAFRRSTLQSSITTSSGGR